MKFYETTFDDYLKETRVLPFHPELKNFENKLNTKDLQPKDISVTPATKKYQITTHAILGATESHALPIKPNQLNKTEG